MKESMLLKLANVVLQNHHFQTEDLVARYTGALIEHAEFVKELGITTANTKSKLDMLAELAWDTGEGDETVYPLLNNALRDFRETGTPPEPFNEVLRD